MRVTVDSMYVEDRSRPEDEYYFFAYSVCIRNEGTSSAQLLSRQWFITNGNGETQEIEGPGVVGYTPHLEEGQEFRYTSFCPLPTPVGTMRGIYRMIDDDGEFFDIEIAPFQLAVEALLH